MAVGARPGREVVLETSRLLLRPWRVAESVVQREPWTEGDPRVPPHRRIDADGHPTVEARIIEAKREGWLGEVEGLQVSYSGVEDKLAQIDATVQWQTTELGMPSFGSIAARSSAKTK